MWMQKPAFGWLSFHPYRIPTECMRGPYCTLETDRQRLKQIPCVLVRVPRRQRPPRPTPQLPHMFRLFLWCSKGSGYPCLILLVRSYSIKKGEKLINEACCCLMLSYVPWPC